jgi:hypothetical protein
MHDIEVAIEILMLLKRNKGKFLTGVWAEIRDM